VALPGLSRGRRATAALLGLVVLACAGCALGPFGKKVYREGAPPITGRPGESIVIELPSDPSTGYSWALVGQADPRIVTLMDSDYEPTKSAAAGAPGFQRWTFRFVSPGTATLTFGYGRTWANAPAEKATLFNVTVR
jgi:predicted secreted protein